MEGDGPTGPMVLREYLLLKTHVEEKLKGSRYAPLYSMYYAMLDRVKKYLAQALACDTLVLATVFHPYWRLAFFDVAFGRYSPESKRARSLFKTKFIERTAKLERSSSSSVCNEENESNLLDDPMAHLHDAAKLQSSNNKLVEWERASDAPDMVVGNNPSLALEWWKVCIFEFKKIVPFRLISL